MSIIKFKEILLIICKLIFNSKNKKNNFNVVDKNLLSGLICGKKFHTTYDAVLEISSEKNKKDKKTKSEIQKLLIENKNKPLNLFNYMKNLGTPIYKVKYASKILSKINEELGFIYPKTGFEAFYLNLIFNKKISFKTSEMFIVEDYEFNIYTLGYEFYKWYYYKANIDSYQQEIQDKFKHIFKYCNDDNISKLSYKELLELKTAVKCDIEAIDFIKELAVRTETSTEKLIKIKQGKKVHV